MRVALVSPYSWTFPGGVTRHIESLAGELREQGHDARVLAPYDPSDRLAARMHRGAWPQVRPVPEWLVPLGRTVGVPANGAVSNVAAAPSSVARLRHELRTGGYDVVHLHEPHAPMLGWDALLSSDLRLPLVGTFHCFSANSLSNGAAVAFGARRRLNRLSERIAVSEAAAWTGRRYYGGRYRIVPNGVTLPPVVPVRPARPAGTMRIAFIGQAVDRKGLPVLLRAFEAVREQLPVELVVIGADEEEVRRASLEDHPGGVRILGRVDEATKHRELDVCDVLCAPSLGGESFGMVLTEALAHGVPVVASDIVGYRDVVSAGRDAVLVPPGDAQALAHALRDLALRPERRRTMSEAATRSAERFSWPRIATRVTGVYADAARAPVPTTRVARTLARHGLKPADGRVPVPARRMPAPDAPAPAAPRVRVRRVLRRGLLVAAAAATVGLGATALEQIGPESIVSSLVQSSPVLVLAALAIMALSMMARAVSWHAILRAALPDAPLRPIHTFRATAIGVLMSATLPARLGEPSRALIMARRLGRPRERLPVVLGTLVSQTLINVLALVLLGTVMISSVRLFQGSDGALLTLTILPAILLAVVLAIPLVLRRGPPGSARLRGIQHRVRGWAHAIRYGLVVFTRVGHGATAIGAQLTAWTLQWLACWVLLGAFGIHAGLAAAAAVLFAVNVTAVLPATPSNLGVFQAACVAVLTTGYGVAAAEALGFGIVLQAVEIATALVLGMPAMLAEGVTWRDVRTRALGASPVDLPPLPAGSRTGAEAES